jgi:hypothetical protein
LEGEIPQRIRDQVTTKRAKPSTNDATNGTTNCESAHTAKSRTRQRVESIRIDVADWIPPDIRIRIDPTREPDGI